MRRGTATARCVSLRLRSSRLRTALNVPEAPYSAVSGSCFRVRASIDLLQMRSLQQRCCLRTFADVFAAQRVKQGEASGWLGNQYKLKHYSPDVRACPFMPLGN